MIVSLVALYPSHLNLNGDLANIKILQQRLAWRGVTATVTNVEKGDGLPDSPDFILLGHGSEAAWADLDSDLARLKPQLLSTFENGVAGLAVASGYERLFQLESGFSLGLLPLKIQRQERLSRFVIADLEGNEALGYLNSDADIEPLMRINKLIGTLPVGRIACAPLGNVGSARGER